MIIIFHQMLQGSHKIGKLIKGASQNRNRKIFQQKWRVSHLNLFNTEISSVIYFDFNQSPPQTGAIKT